jgi:hypothetical protein
VTEGEYRTFLKNLGQLPAEAEKPARKHKFNAKKVEIDGHVFHSKWEGQVYTDLKWQALAGQITFPLLQVPFSLGEWQTMGAKKPRERFYIADFVHIELKSGELVVVDAKGFETKEYRQKRRAFCDIYGFPITEYRR